MIEQLAFIDEFGNNSLDFSKQDISTHFIIAAIIIDPNELAAVENEIEKVRKEYFQTGEIKSSLVADNDNRRTKILNDLVTINFHIFAVVVDKRKLTSEGFRYPGSFYKFVHGLADKELFFTFPNLKITADQFGRSEFMEGFIKYVNNKHIHDLFNYSEFCFTDSRSSPAIQVADFISGTLARCFDATKVSGKASEFMALLKSRLIGLKQWPVSYDHRTYKPDDKISENSKTITSLGLRLAHRFIAENEDTAVPSEKDQVNCLKYLLFYFMNISRDKYIQTHELVKNLEYGHERKISPYYFRSKIIAKLRDAGVIVSSSSNGYKLPCNESDLYDFINHSNTIIKPMVSRIKRCRDSVKLATKTLDILDKAEYDDLRVFLDRDYKVDIEPVSQ